MSPARSWAHDDALPSHRAMIPGATFERIYASLRGRLSAGRFVLGEPLEPAHLADDLNASITPVRDALHRLVGERLVDVSLGGGFRVPLLTEVGLRNLYDWNRRLLFLALADASRSAAASNAGALRDRPEADVPERTATLFSAIAALSSNPECAAAVAAAGERLAFVRRKEIELMDQHGAAEELARLTALHDDKDWPSLRRAIGAYHRHRIRLAGELIAALHKVPQ